MTRPVSHDVLMRPIYRHRRAFTLVELLVVIGIIALLISILLPALSKARNAGARIACASNMHQIGIAFAIYLNEYKGTYPPEWYSDNWTNLTSSQEYTGNSAVNGVCPNASYVTLLAKYLGPFTGSYYTGTNFGIFKCPNDLTVRDSFLSVGATGGGGPLSYSMPITWGPDPINITNRLLAQGDSPLPTANGSAPTLNRGVGQIWCSGNYPMWVTTGMVRLPAQVLLLVERSYSEEAQCTCWNLGYQVSRPADQMWANLSINSSGAVYGFPMLHSENGQQHEAHFNYLFCDNHVEYLRPAQTVHDTAQLIATQGEWEGGDFMWTIAPLTYWNW